MKKYSILSLFVFSSLFAQSLPTTPKEVVIYALSALTNGEIEKLLEVTGRKELRQTEELLSSIEGNAQKRRALLNQYKSLKSWSIESIDEQVIQGRTLAVIATKWVVIPFIEDAPKNDFAAPKTQTLYVNYMLEKLENQWKIIDRRSL